MGSRFRGNRGVSEVIAVVLVIAISVGAAILLYVFAIGTVSLTGGGQQVTQQLILESYNWNANSNQLRGSFKNAGTTPIALDSADAFINGTPVTLTVATSTVNPKQSTTFTVTVGISGSFVQGASYPFKIVTASGAVFSYTVVLGGSS